MEKIRTKLKNLLKEKIGDEYHSHIEHALKDKKIEGQIKGMMKEEKI